MLLDQDHLMIRDAVRTFVRDAVTPNAARWDRERTFPADVHRQLAELGAYGVLVPEEYGGAGADHVAYALALAEIAAGDGALSTVVSGHNSVGVMPILNYGTEAQKQRYVRDLAAGAKLTAFCLTDPPCGSVRQNAPSISPRASGVSQSRF